MEILDILIIGGGPIGLNCALEAQKNNLTYLIIEKGTIVNSLYNYPLYMRFFSTAEKLEIDKFLSYQPLQNLEDRKPWNIIRNCKTTKSEHQLIRKG
jgi:thioredoxin reductase (NADPH)